MVQTSKQQTLERESLLPPVGNEDLLQTVAQSGFCRHDPPNNKSSRSIISNQSCARFSRDGERSLRSSTHLSFADSTLTCSNAKISSFPASHRVRWKLGLPASIVLYVMILSQDDTTGSNSTNSNYKPETAVVFAGWKAMSNLR